MSSLHQKFRNLLSGIMGSGQSSPKCSSTVIQVQNPDYTPREQFAEQGKPLFKKTNQSLSRDEGSQNTKGQNKNDVNCKIEKDLEEVSISENEIHGL